MASYWVLTCLTSWSSEVPITISARWVRGTMRVWVRHPVNAGTRLINPAATIFFKLMGTNFKYIYPRTHSGLQVSSPRRGVIFLYSSDWMLLSAVAFLFIEAVRSGGLLLLRLAVGLHLF